MDSPKLEGKQRPEIDGLRALAIAEVILFHGGLACPSGFVGVDIFFVISGFLIGGIILRELDAGAFSFRKFWERRVRRIVPALLFFFAVTLFVGWRILPPKDLASLASQTVWGLAGLANLKTMAMTGGYWATNANSILLLHVWSLAVEEQFYLLLPIVLALSHRWFRRRIEIVILALFGASLFLSLYWGAEGYAGNFYLLPPRAWELLLGCIGAWALHHGLTLPRQIQSAATAAGVMGIFVSAFILHDDPSWPDARTLLPTVATLLILLSPAPKGEIPWALQFLSLPPLRYVGLVSYSLYLWHWPVMVLLREYGPEQISLRDRCGAVAVSLALATLSWRFIELPFRNKLPHFRITTKPLFIGTAALWICLVIASKEMAHAFSATQGDPAMSAFFNTPGRESIIEYDATSRVKDGGIIINAERRAPRCVVLGSSHGMMLGPVVRSLSDDHHVPCAFFCQLATSPLFVPDTLTPRAPRKIRDMQKRDQLVKGYILRWKPDLIILAAKWNKESLDWGKGLGPFWPSFPEAVSNTLSWLSQHASKVAVVGQVPELPFRPNDDPVRIIWRRYRDRGGVMPLLEEPVDVATQRAEAVALFRSEPFTNVTLLDPAPTLQNADGSLRYYSSGELLYFDYNHLNSLGSKELRPLFEPFFTNRSR